MTALTDDHDTPPVRVIGATERHEHYVHVAEERFEQLELDVRELMASRKTMNRLVWLAIPGLIGALVTVLLFAADKIATSSRHAGEADADMRNFKDQLEHQRNEIIELRAALYRKSGVDPLPNSDLQDPDYRIDKFASGTPASVNGGTNGSIGCDRHRPPLQNRHWPPNWAHSELLEQMLRHPPSGLGAGRSSGAAGLLQAAMTTPIDMM